MTREKAVQASNLLAKIDQLDALADELQGVFNRLDLDLDTSKKFEILVDGLIDEAKKALEEL